MFKKNIYRASSILIMLIEKVKLMLSLMLMSSYLEIVNFIFETNFFRPEVYISDTQIT